MSAITASQNATLPGAVKPPGGVQGAAKTGGQKGVNRPLPLGVNVFFDFGLNGTYQSGRLLDLDLSIESCRNHRPPRTIRSPICGARSIASMRRCMNS